MRTTNPTFSYQVQQEQNLTDQQQMKALFKKMACEFKTFYFFPNFFTTDILRCIFECISFRPSTYFGAYTWI